VPAHRLRERALTAILGCLAGSLGACASGSPSLSGGSDASRSHGALTDREFDVAGALARHEADSDAASVMSATATVGAGTVTDSNTGNQCASGTLLHITLIGDFNIATGGMPTMANGDVPGGNGVHAVLITADPETGLACLISVRTGNLSPDPDANVLFTS
jgi:hypothetical protein